jgi:hypothetical protein
MIVRFNKTDRRKRGVQSQNLSEPVGSFLSHMFAAALRPELAKYDLGNYINALTGAGISTEEGNSNPRVPKALK